MPSYYGQDFRYKGDSNPYPGKAHVYDSLKHVKDCYKEFIADSEKFGFGDPGDYYVYKGKPDCDEETHGYPEFPDYILSLSVVPGKIACSKLVA